MRSSTAVVILLNEESQDQDIAGILRPVINDRNAVIVVGHGIEDQVEFEREAAIVDNVFGWTVEVELAETV